MDELLASIKLFAGNFVPRGYALCNGALLQAQQNVALFSLLGTQYGGDGVRTFALPDLRPVDTTYQIGGTKDAPVVIVQQTKRDWKVGEPRPLIATVGIYPERE